MRVLLQKRVERAEPTVGTIHFTTGVLMFPSMSPH